MNIQRTRCPREQLAGPARLTYILVDHKWVCFADCCRWGPLARHARGSVEYASPRGPRYGARLMGSIICAAPISPRVRARIRHLETPRNPEVCRPSLIRRRESL